MDFFYHSPVDFCIVGLNSIKELGKGDQRDILGCYVVVLCKNVKIFFLIYYSLFNLCAYLKVMDRITGGVPALAVQFR